MELTRIRLLSESEILSRAGRNNNIGAIVLEKFHMLKGSSGGFYIEISSHITMAEAEKAKTKLGKKLSIIL